MEFWVVAEFVFGVPVAFTFGVAVTFSDVWFVLGVAVRFGALVEFGFKVTVSLFAETVVVWFVTSGESVLVLVFWVTLLPSGPGVMFGETVELLLLGEVVLIVVALLFTVVMLEDPDVTAVVLLVTLGPDVELVGWGDIELLLVVVSFVVIVTGFAVVWLLMTDTKQKIHRSKADKNKQDPLFKSQEHEPETE